MSTDPSTVDFILDQTSSAGKVSARKMFGEYALYCDGKVVGLICNDTLYIKITPQGKEHIGSHYREGHAYHGAKPSMVIDGDLIENRDWISALISLTAKNISSKPKPKPKKRK